MPAYNGNVAALALERMEQSPDRLALAVFDAGNGDLVEEATFAALGDRVARFRAGLGAAGMGEGDRIVLLGPLTVDFYALALALLACGAVAVIVDGALDRRTMLRAVDVAQAKAIVTVASALRPWPLLPALRRMRRYAVDQPPRGVEPLSRLLADHAAAGPPLPRSSQDPAIISFTSGSGGRPKGADRTHGLLNAQHQALARNFPYGPSDVDMPCFPVLVLHNLSCGVPTVLPPVDLRRAASVEPLRVLRAVAAWDVTSLSGAPAYMQRLATAACHRREDVGRVRRVLVGGAPVSGPLADRLLEGFPDARVEVLYGSTEAEPIARAPLEEVRATAAAGFLAGTPVPEVEVELVALPAPPPVLDADGLRPYRTTVGEVVVRGNHVNRRYVGNPAAEHELKLQAPDGGVWHRTGDVAMADERGRLWLQGRTDDVVAHHGRLLHPFPIEAALLRLPCVDAAALVSGAGDRAQLAMVAAAGMEADVLPVAREHLRAAGLEDVELRLLERMPVDRRHNSKVDRRRLRRQLRPSGWMRATTWAAGLMGHRA